MFGDIINRSCSTKNILMEEISHKSKNNKTLETNRNNEIINLKKALSSKNKIITDLQNELELSKFKSNLNNKSNYSKKSLNSIPFSNRYESSAKIKEKLNRISIQKSNKLNDSKLALDEIQNQISELNVQLKSKKNLLNKIKKQNDNDEIKFRTCSNWNANYINQYTAIKDLNEKIEKYENENIDLKALIKVKDKELLQLNDENRNNKEENNILLKKINEIKININKITKENNQIKIEQKYLNNDINEIKKNNEKINKEKSLLMKENEKLKKDNDLLLKENNKLNKDILNLRYFENENDKNIIIINNLKKNIDKLKNIEIENNKNIILINKLKDVEKENNKNVMLINKLNIDVDTLNNKLNNYLKEKEQLLAKIKNLLEENEKLANKNNELNLENIELKKEKVNIESNNSNNYSNLYNKIEYKDNNLLYNSNSNNAYLSNTTISNNNHKLNFKGNNDYRINNNINNNSESINLYYSNINNNSEPKNTFLVKDKNSQILFKNNESSILTFSRNNSQKNKKNETYFNYSNIPNSGYHSNYKLFKKSDMLYNNLTYTPKLIETKKIINEEEKGNKDDEKFISSFNAQIYNLESQIEQLQNKVIELNSQNININKDKKKLKNYEQIIEKERNKVKEAENTILKLRQEIAFLKESYNNNIDIISQLKNENRSNHFKKSKNKINNLLMDFNKDKYKRNNQSRNDILNLDKFINDLHQQVNGLNRDLNNIKLDVDLPKNKNNNNDIYKYKENYYKNSNDIFYDENCKNSSFFEKKRTKTYSEGKSHLNKNHKYINDYDKLKGSDIDMNFKIDNHLYSSSNEETNHNLIY